MQRVVYAYAQASQVIAQITASLQFEEPTQSQPQPKSQPKSSVTPQQSLVQQKIEEVNKGRTDLPIKE